MDRQIGARWLAHQQQDSGAGESSQCRAAQPQCRDLRPRYALTDCMSERALAEWWRVLVEYGAGDTSLVQ